MEHRNRLHPEKPKRRKEIVEHPFGTSNRSIKQGYFLMRGLEKVKAEMSLTGTTHNIKRVLNILGVIRMVQPALARRTRRGQGLTYFPFRSLIFCFLHGLTAGWANYSFTIYFS
jgi:hypothetical protein